MKLKDIKVGGEYVVSDKGFRGNTYNWGDPCRAVVADMNAPYSYERRRYNGEHETVDIPQGGLRVTFPVETLQRGWDGMTQNPEIIARFKNGVVCEDGYNPFASWRLVTEHTFHSGGRNKAPFGTYFLDTWENYQAQQEADAKAQEEHETEVAARAAQFAPVLDAYRERLAAVGIQTTLRADGSGIYGDGFSLGLYADNGRPTGFRGDVKLNRDLFDGLVALASAAVATVEPVR